MTVVVDPGRAKVMAILGPDRDALVRVFEVQFAHEGASAALLYLSDGVVYRYIANAAHVWGYKRVDGLVGWPR